MKMQLVDGRLSARRLARALILAAVSATASSRVSAQGTSGLTPMFSHSPPAPFGNFPNIISWEPNVCPPTLLNFPASVGLLHSYTSNWSRVGAGANIVDYVPAGGKTSIISDNRKYRLVNPRITVECILIQYKVAIMSVESIIVSAQRIISGTGIEQVIGPPRPGVRLFGDGATGQTITIGVMAGDALTVGMDGSSSVTDDPDIAITSYAWTVNGAHAGANVAANYSLSQTATVSLTITDETGQSATASGTVNVSRRARVSLSRTGMIGLKLRATSDCDGTGGIATLRPSDRVSPSTMMTGETWTSSNAAVATVSSDGVVTGVKTGTVVIRADCAGMLPGTASIRIIAPDECDAAAGTCPLGDTSGGGSGGGGTETDCRNYHVWVKNQYGDWFNTGMVCLPDMGDVVNLDANPRGMATADLARVAIQPAFSYGSPGSTCGTSALSVCWLEIYRTNDFSIDPRQDPWVGNMAFSARGGAATYPATITFRYNGKVVQQSTATDQYHLPSPPVVNLSELPGSITDGDIVVASVTFQGANGVTLTSATSIPVAFPPDPGGAMPPMSSFVKRATRAWVTEHRRLPNEKESREIERAVRVKMAGRP
jgi:hypothetical protein